MCDLVLIAAILDELGYFDEKKEKDKKDEIDDEERSEDTLENSGEEEKQFESIVNKRFDPFSSYSFLLQGCVPFLQNAWLAGSFLLTSIHYFYMVTA